MTWGEFAQKYHVSFKDENGDFIPVNKFLDDLYLTSSLEKTIEMIQDYWSCADDLFNETYHK